MVLVGEKSWIGVGAGQAVPQERAALTDVKTTWLVGED
jgi:hypothetical protein